MSKKLLLIGPLSKGDYGGVSLGFESLIQGARSAGYHASVVDTLWGGAQKVNGRFTAGRAIKSLIIVLQVWVKTFSSSSIYITLSSSKAGFIKDCMVIWPAWLLRKRMVCHLKGGGYGLFYESCPTPLKWLVRLTLNRASQIIVLGELLRDQFDFVRDANRKLTVVPNGLPLGLRERDEPKELASTEKPLRILYLSNLIPSKGFLDLLAACRALHRRGLQFRCDFCGSFIRTVEDKGGTAWTADLFQKRIDEWGLSNAVFYHGSVSGHEKQAMLEDAHCLVLATAFPWEGQPISIIEALAYATPVISTRFRGIPEEVEDGYNGYFVPYGDPEAIAARLESLATNPTVYAKLSRNALEHFRSNFTRTRHLANLLAAITCDPPDTMYSTLASAHRGSDV